MRKQVIQNINNKVRIQTGKNRKTGRLLKNLIIINEVLIQLKQLMITGVKCDNF
jgi:hypothetical protein